MGTMMVVTRLMVMMKQTPNLSLVVLTMEEGAGSGGLAHRYYLISKLHQR